MTKIACPKCTKNDCVEKLSAIVEKTPTSNLAKKLSPPELNYPERAPLFGMQQGLGCLAALFFGSFFFVSVANASLTGSLIFGFFTLLFVIFFTLIIIKGYKNRREEVKIENEWGRKMELWEELFYCKDDKIVFDPRNERSSGLDHWKSLFEE